MDCSRPGFPVLHCPPRFAQTHVRWVGDAMVQGKKQGLWGVWSGNPPPLGSRQWAVPLCGHFVSSRPASQCCAEDGKTSRRSPVQLLQGEVGGWGPPPPPPVVAAPQLCRRLLTLVNPESPVPSSSPALPVSLQRGLLRTLTAHPPMARRVFP